MIVAAALLLGIAWGIRTASRRGGKRLDKLQYGAAAGIAGALLGLVVTIVVERML